MAPLEDAAWGAAASSRGHRVTHFSFAGHQTMVPKRQVVVLREADLAGADRYCEQANRTLQRTYPPKSQRVRNLLRRNWFAVHPATSCYAVSTESARTQC